MTATSASQRALVLRSPGVVTWLGLAAGAVVLQILFWPSEGFPALLDTFFSDPIDQAAAWGRANRRSHVLFTGFFTPLTGILESAMAALEGVLTWIPWFVLPVAVFVVVARTRDWKRASAAALAMAYPGLVGLWDVTMETLSLMLVAVAVAVVIGVPLGVWAALRPGLERALRPVLDVMQTVPAFVYFLPLMVFFGVGRVNGAIATVIYALPPVVRLTTLGIRQVPSQTVEAARMFGSSTRQVLTKVQLPMARPTILTGVSQTIMMALGVVVLAALVAAGGLGEVVLQTLSQRRTGRGIAAGLAIVSVAMVLDRLGRSLAESSRLRPFRLQTKLVVAGALVVGVVVGRAAGWVAFPEVWDTSVFDPIDRLVVWARDNLSWLTRPVNDFVVGSVIVPLRDLLTEVVAWPVLVFVTAWACWRIKGWRLALFGGAAVAFMGLVGMWALSIDTLVQVMTGVVIAVALAVPIGIWAGRRPRVETAIGPFLDALQTIPSLVYIIPVVILFTVGAVPGIIASVLYAVVPGIRITALGIRQVAEESVEASQMFGATPRQTMLGVRIPLAGPTIMAAVNQVIMMVLAMVIISGLVGGGALGFETIRALTTSDNGLGFEVGTSIALMAMVLDRFTQSWADRLRPPARV